MFYFFLILFLLYFATGLLCNLIELYEYFRTKDKSDTKYKLEETK